MFQKIKLKLSFICCLSTTLIVLIIILICMNVSEKNMYEQEKALFFLKSNAISSDLQGSRQISISWYQDVADHTKDFLYIEINRSPTTLSNVVLSHRESIFIDGIKEYMKNHFPYDTTIPPDSKQHYFEYQKDGHRFLVMDTTFFNREKKYEIHPIYVYCLDNFYHNVTIQRIWFFAIWFGSVLALYLFSYFFTSHVLKPLIQYDEKQKHFIAFASHELRSPLAVLKTGFSILKKKPDGKKTERIFALIDSEMSRMERLIQDLLCLSKMEHAGFRFQFQCANLASLVTSIYETYAVVAKNKNISLSLWIEDSCCYDCTCDPQRIEQAVIILLDNALSYTPSGQKVFLRLYRLRGKYEIQVIDTGKGITDQEKEKIFDRFYQADSSRKQKEHFGLGLSIAKEICHAHRGKICVGDTKGGGSTFTIRLPKNSRNPFL